MDSVESNENDIASSESEDSENERADERNRSYDEIEEDKVISKNNTMIKEVRDENFEAEINNFNDKEK